MAFIFKELHDLVQIDVLTHLLDEMLCPLVQELLEVGSLLDFCIRGLTERLIVITAPAFIIKASEDLLFDSYDFYQTVLPQVLLPRSRSHTARLLIANLDHLRHDAIESLDMLIRLIHFLEKNIEQGVDNFEA